MSVTGRRQRLALILAVGCAVLSTAGLIASTFVRSPQQLRADTAPPDASQLTSRVERRVLASTLVTRGKVEADSRIEFTPAITQGAAVQVVTATSVASGQQIRPGQVLAAVSGRPVFTLLGAVPAYRDFKPGESGLDIAQLQAALRALGHYRGGDKAGYFGSATKAAIGKLYGKLGFSAPDTGGPEGRGDRQALAAATASVQTAQDNVDALRRRISGGEVDKPGEMPLREQLSRLERALRAAKAARADLVAHTGPMIPLSEVVFIPSFPAHVAAFTAKVGDSVKAPLITFAAGKLNVTAKLRQDQGKLVRAGMKVLLTSETLGREVNGVVATVGELTAPAEGAVNAVPFHPVVVQPGTALPADWSGQDIRVTVIAAETAQPVLVVPLSAVSAGADGKTSVSTVDAAGKASIVAVRAGVTGDGFVEVTPVSGELEEGDKVIVGTQ